VTTHEGDDPLPDLTFGIDGFTDVSWSLLPPRVVIAVNITLYCTTEKYSSDEEASIPRVSSHRR